MTVARAIINPWAAAALGSVATLAVLGLGPVAMASGWVAPACTALLVSAAAGVLVDQALRSRHMDASLSGASTFAMMVSQQMELCQKPSEWIADSGALGVPDGEIEGTLRARLVGSLSPRPFARSGRWEAAMPEPIALLALALAARGGRRDCIDRKVGIRMLDDLRHAMTLPTEPERSAALAELRAGIAHHLDDNGAIARSYRRALESHGTRESFMLGLLSQARLESGVLASGEFAWLKREDRSLWYALNNLGRQRFLVEGIAAMAHFRCELAAKRAFVEPRVEDAIETLADLCRDLRARGWQPDQAGERGRA